MGEAMTESPGDSSRLQLPLGAPSDGPTTSTLSARWAPLLAHIALLCQQRLTRAMVVHRRWWQLPPDARCFIKPFWQGCVMASSGRGRSKTWSAQSCLSSSSLWARTRHTISISATSHLIDVWVGAGAAPRYTAFRRGRRWSGAERNGTPILVAGELGVVVGAEALAAGTPPSLEPSTARDGELRTKTPSSWWSWHHRHLLHRLLEGMPGIRKHNHVTFEWYKILETM